MIKFISRIFFLTCLFTSLNIVLYKVKLHPTFKGIDPKVNNYTGEFFDLASLYGKKFDHSISIGFGNINKPNIIAITEYGLGFREITIDSTYWKTMSPIDNNITVWHEMGHGYCNEGHQFGKDHKKYDEDGVNPKDGFFDDSCPKSLMYPYSTYEGCFYVHFQEYVDDLFQNCRPY